jgi:hypothetical protein
MKKITVRKIAWFILVLSVGVLQPATAQTNKAKSSGTKSTGIMSSMTVRAIVPAGGGSDYIKVGFTTSSRVFKLSPKANPEYAKRLKLSMDKHTPVYVFRSSEESDIIQKVVVPAAPAQKKK